jgi:predicted ATP-dependent endonuclease of OLD family
LAIKGKNNAGKSTLLEAVEIYASNAAPIAILDILKSRQETWFSEAQQHFQGSTENYIRHLFFGRKLPKIEEPGIVLSQGSDETAIGIFMAAYQETYDDRQEIQLLRRVRLALHDINDIAQIRTLLVAEDKESTRIISNLHHRNARSIYDLKTPKSKYIWQVVPTGNITNRKLAILWDLISLTELESEVINALKLIDTKVDGVAFVEDSSQPSDRDRIPLVKMSGIEEPLPLKSMGDGMNRLFNIIIALCNARNGLLLIDEFENGLHWTVQPQVWDIVFRLSERLNVQVFATTHSRDCVTGFDRAWNQYTHLGAFLRLDAKKDSIEVTEYTNETLTDAIEMDVEMR